MCIGRSLLIPINSIEPYYVAGLTAGVFIYRFSYIKWDQYMREIYSPSFIFLNIFPKLIKVKPIKVFVSRKMT